MDSKSIRNLNSKTTGKSVIHVRSPFPSENRLWLGQQVVDQKSNEITAIPKLLQILDTKGCIVTNDASCVKKRLLSKLSDSTIFFKKSDPFQV